MPVRLVELLRARGYDLVEVPDEEFESMGCNVLALGPRVRSRSTAIRETRRRLEARDDVRGYTGEESLAEGRRRSTWCTRPRKQL